MTLRNVLFTLALLSFCAAVLAAKKQTQYEQARPLTSEQSALVEKAIAREKIVIENIRQRTPLVETYIQNTKTDEKLGQVPAGDEYILSRVDFGKAFFDKTYESRASTNQNGFKHRLFSGSLSAIALQWNLYASALRGCRQILFSLR